MYYFLFFPGTFLLFDVYIYIFIYYAEFPWFHGYSAAVKVLHIQQFLVVRPQRGGEGGKGRTNKKKELFFLFPFIVYLNDPVEFCCPLTKS